MSNMRLFLIALFGAGWAVAQPPAPAQTTSSLPTLQDLPRLLDSANTSYLKGDYAGSFDTYRTAAVLVEQTPPENPQRYDVLKRLAAACSATGQIAMAIIYLRRAVEWRRQIIGADDPKVYADMDQTADLYRMNSDFQTARKILDDVLAAHLKSPGEDSREVADDHSRIALLILAQADKDKKKIDEAVPEFETALAIRAHVAGQLDMTLVPDLDRIGPLYLGQADYEKAEVAFRRALVIRESLLGSESPDLIPSVDGLAYAYFGQRNFPAADAMYQRLLKLWEKSVGPTHPMMATALDKLGVFYSAQKKETEAIAAYEHANAIRAHFYATGRSQEAAEDVLQGNLVGARAQYENALKVLDAPNAIYDKLKGQITDNVGSIDQALKAPPSPRTAPKK